MVRRTITAAGMALQAATESLEQSAKETVITPAEIDRAKRAVVVLMEIYKAAMGGKQAPLELRQDIQTLMGLIRKIEEL